MEFWGALSDHLEAGQRAVLGIVGDHTRHSPGTRGAKMFVRPDGSQFGTIGGGVMEAELLKRAPDLTGQSEEVLHHRSNAEGLRSGLICAGKQTMVYVVATPRDAPMYRAFATAVCDDEEVRLVLEDGGVRVEPSAVGDTAPIALVDGVYSEHAVNHQRVAIAGGGHCGLALCRVLHALDYHITLFEVREHVFTFADNDVAHDRIVVADYADAAKHIRFTELTHFVVMTANVDADVRALIGALPLPFPYVGVMGSPAKISRIREELEAAGVADDATASLYAPIGLDMTSNTPPEIAISIAAQLLREREKLFPWTRPTPMGQS